MYVLLDIEWLNNKQNHFGPTQIAALRVTNEWSGQGLFYRRIRPRDPSFHNWNHMAYTGGTAEDFLRAQSLYSVISDFMAWLREDDVLCVWHKDTKSMLKSAVNIALKRGLTQEILILQQYMPKHLKRWGIANNSPHKIVKARGWDVSKPIHQANNDVINMRRALMSLCFRAEELETAQAETSAAATKDMAQERYYMEPQRSVVHLPGCSHIPTDAIEVMKPEKGFLFKEGIRFCSCMAEVMSQKRRERNRDTIARSQYNYVYAENSKVFHRRNCGLILKSTAMIKGSVYYEGCIRADKRPCKICNPVAEKRFDYKIKKNNIRKIGVGMRSLTSEEQRSMLRYRQAREERFSKGTDDFKSEIDKADFYTLTQSRFGFFAAKGYNTFHLRHCRKLQGLTHIHGFATYKDAVRAGHQPCKYCKPTKKHDITCSVPITNQQRAGESIKDLEELCLRNGYPFNSEGTWFGFQTPVGKWIIEIATKPYVVQHINLTVTPDNESNFHRQPRLFLSMTDAFEYIHRHDLALLSKRCEAPMESMAAEG